MSGGRRVRVLTPFFPHPGDSVVGAFVLDHAAALQEEGWLVDVVCPTPWVPPLLGGLPRWRGYRDRPKRWSRRGLDVSYPRYVRPPGRWFRGWAGHSMARALPVSGPADLVIAHTLLPAGEAAVRSQKVPVVVVCHGSDVYQHAEESRRTLASAERTLSGASAVVCVSRSLREKVLELGSPRVCEVVYNGVDLERFVPLGDERRRRVRRRFGLDPEAQTILFVGLDYERKGLKPLLEAFAQLRRERQDVQLAVVGPPAGIVSPAAGVVALGRRPIEDMPDLTGSADVSVLPSYEEAFGCTLLEAASCAVPVVGSSVDGIREVVVDEETGLLVPAGNSEHLLQSLRRLVDNAALRRRLGDGGLARVRRDFSWQVHARRMGQLLDTCLR